MISLKINDIKNFMSALLIGNTFDFLSVSEVSLTTFNTFHIKGHINKNFYTTDELDELKDKNFSSWTQIKPICFNLIKGTKTPDRFKITFCMPSGDYDTLITKSGANLTPENISGLYVHFTYENGILSAITATSLSIFTMDKTLDQYWDNTIQSFLVKHFNVDRNE